MPCRDYYSDYEISVYSQRRIDEITKVACAMGRLLQRRQMLEELPKYASDWYHSHLEQDTKRRAAEKEERRRKNLIKSALAKLTEEEKELLGWNEADAN